MAPDGMLDQLKKALIERAKQGEVTHHRCAVHGASESVASCGWCATHMCDVCFRFVVVDAPICVRCAHERTPRARRRVALGVFTLLVSLGIAGLVGKRVTSTDWGLQIALATGLVGTAVGLLLALAGMKQAQALPALQPREEAHA